MTGVGAEKKMVGNPETLIVLHGDRLNLLEQTGRVGF